MNADPVQGFDGSAALPDFATPALAVAVEQLPREVIDTLPFGAIHLDRDGVVAFYSEAERRLSGYRKEVLARPFFTEIAPCMNNAAFKGRIERALAAGTLDIAFDHIGDFDDSAKMLRVRVQSAIGGGCWIFMQRE
jgi:photoactive yellow protein